MEIFLSNCLNANTKKVEDCLSEGTDVNTVSEYGEWSALTIAAHQNYPELLEILLSHPDILINKTTVVKGCHWTALMFACYSGNSVIVSRLVQVPGVDIMYQDKNGSTAAHMASQQGHSECLRILAETGKVDWNRRDLEGLTPLYLALYTMHPDCVDIIVQQSDIDYNAKTSFGATFAHAAVSETVEDTQCVEILAAQERCGDCWNVPDEDGETPIMFAIGYYMTEIIEVIVRYPHIDLNCRDRKGNTPVMKAIKRGHTEIVEILVGCPRVDLNCTNNDGDTPVMSSLKSGRTELLELLVRCPRVDLNCRDKDGWSLVFRAMAKRKKGKYF